MPTYFIFRILIVVLSTNLQRSTLNSDFQDFTTTFLQPRESLLEPIQARTVRTPSGGVLCQISARLVEFIE